MPQAPSSFVKAEITWLSLGEFTQVSGLSSAEVRELVEIGILSPTGASAGDWLFNHQAMALARRLRRLQEDLDIKLDLHALALGFSLLERISELETQLCRERAAHLRE
jgi:DNA-binding transcriptional MerR regulator